MLQRKALLPALCGALLLAAPASWAENIRFRAAADADLAITFTSEIAALAASGLDASARCGSSLPRVAFVDLAWSHGATLGEDSGMTGQRVDISKRPEGFKSGDFETTGTLASSFAAVAVEAPEPGVKYYWRVLSGSADGWVVSPVRRFRVPVCKSDPLEPDQAAGLILNPTSGEQ